VDAWFGIAAHAVVSMQFPGTPSTAQPNIAPSDASAPSAPASPDPPVPLELLELVEPVEALDVLDEEALEAVDAGEPPELLVVLLPPSPPLDVLPWVATSRAQAAERSTTAAGSQARRWSMGFRS
jgi:hypothetical protein